MKRENNDFNTITVIEKLKELIDDSLISNSFVDDIQIKTLKSGEVFLIFPTKNDFKYMNKNYKDLMEQAIKHVFGLVATFKITYKEEFDSVIEQSGPMNTKNSNLNSRYKLEEYIEGKFNESVISMGKNLLKNVDTVKYNPLFIHSSSGMGKTHFLNAVGNEYVKKAKSVSYISPDAFIKKVTQYLIQSNQEKLTEIIDYYKDFDVLLFDDIQQYGSKPATLNVLLNILNHHIENNKQIIIVADKNPDLLGGFEERFITRFQGGITLEIQQPSLDDLLKIFKEKLKQHNLNPLDWETEAMKFIVRNHSNSIRTLEGAINKIDWNNQQEVGNIKYTYQVVSQIFSSITKDIENISPDLIIDVVSKYYNINKSDILGNTRRKDIVLARHISMWLIRNTLNKTYKEIGTIFKGKDHSTVMTAVDKIDYQMKVNETVKNALKIIKIKINNS